MRDTDPEVEKIYNERIMALEPGERLEMCLRMFDYAKALVIAGIRHEFGQDISEVELRKQIFLRFYGGDFCDEEKEKIIAAMSCKMK